MASIDKRGTTWRARWRSPDGKSRSQAFARKIDAERHLISVEHSKLVGGYVDPAEGKMTFGDYAEAWRASQPHREQTAASTETYLRLHVYPYIGARPIGSIRRSEMQAWAKGLGATLAPSTVATIRQKVNAVFAAALATGSSRRIPAPGSASPGSTASRSIPSPTARWWR